MDVGSAGVVDGVGGPGGRDQGGGGAACVCGGGGEGGGRVLTATAVAGHRGKIYIFFSYLLFP